MFATDAGINSTDLTHAGALLIGLVAGIWMTLRVVRIVFGMRREERRNRLNKEDNDADS